MRRSPTATASSASSGRAAWPPSISRTISSTTATPHSRHCAPTWRRPSALGFVSARWPEAIRVLRELQTRDSLSSYLAAVLAVGLSAAGDPDEALAWSERAVALEPDAFLPVWTRQLAYYQKRDWRRSIEAGEVALAASARSGMVPMHLGHALVEAGDVDGARAVFAQMGSRSRREHITPLSMASVAAALGEREEAVALAREAHARRDPHLVVYGLEWGQTRHLRALPEYQAILADMKIPGWGPGAAGWPGGGA